MGDIDPLSMKWKKLCKHFGPISQVSSHLKNVST